MGQDCSKVVPTKLQLHASAGCEPKWKRISKSFRDTTQLQEAVAVADAVAVAAAVLLLFRYLSNGGGPFHYIYI